MAALLWWIPHISLPPLKDMFILLPLPNYRVAGEEGSWRQNGGGGEGWAWGGERQWAQVFRNSWSSNEKKEGVGGGRTERWRGWVRENEAAHKKKRQQINISWEMCGICDELFMMIDIIKRGKKKMRQTCAQFDMAARATWCALYTQIQWLTGWQTQPAHCPGIYDTQYLTNTGRGLSSRQAVSSSSSSSAPSANNAFCFLFFKIWTWIELTI